MAKKKGNQGRRGKSFEEPVITRVKFPSKRLGEMFAIVIEILGGERMRVSVKMANRGLAEYVEK